MDRSPASPIAIVGMGCRFPGARDAEEYRKLLLEGRCAIQEIPAHRFNQARYFDPVPGAYAKSYSRLGGCIPDGGFDAEGLRQPSTLAESTDPAHLWALEVAKSALESAGLDPWAMTGRNVAVVLGHSRGGMLNTDIGFSTAVEGLLGDLEKIGSLAGVQADRREGIRRAALTLLRKRYPFRTAENAIGTMTSRLAGLISSTFRLSGRHMVVDAACASSFAALEIAVRALRQGSVDLALSGGVSYSQEMSMVLFSQARALSSEGSFPFDETASGFISSDGVGIVVLERLDDAVRHGRRILGLVRGIGGSCDGKGKGLWAPRKEGQVLAIGRAYARSNVDPSDIGMLEAHATGTSLGDKTEVEALTDFFGPRVKPGTKIPVGSVKSNIGHTREAAGIASLIKVLHAFDSETIPPSIGYKKPSAGIQWEKTPLQHATVARAWRRGPKPRLAGVDAFGIGGLNYHVIVEEPPTAERVKELLALPDEKLTPKNREPIAIVGVGCVLPEARGASEYWSLLKEGRVALRDVPASRWSAEIYHQTGKSSRWRTYSKRGGFVTGFEPDWRRYKIPPKLVEGTDPLQFMLLESATEALEDAGVDLSKVDRQRVSTLVGSIFGSDYALDLTLSIRVPEIAEAFAEALESEGVDSATAASAVSELEALVRSRLPVITEDSSGSSSSSTLASRISKTLDLQGATFSVDAACASSMASLEAACESLWAQDCDFTLWGGGDRSMRVQRFEAPSQFDGLSRTERCVPLDASADGFLPGEGAVVCVLQRLSDAKRDGRRIYAVVKGIGSASDRGEGSLSTPSGSALAEAMERAYSSSGVDPRSVGFAECSGTGNPAGDGAELIALRQVLCAEGRSRALVVGSVKANLGHTGGAAGAAAVAKAALALHHGIVPPTTGVTRPHANLSGPIAVTSTESGWSTDAPARAAVSSMGMGGILYHAVLEADAKPAQPAGLDGDLCFLFPGQGSQYPGMLRELANDYPSAKSVLDELDEILSRRGEMRLSTVLWDRTDRMSEVLWTQLSVLGGDLMVLAVAREQGLHPALVTCHSYGEYPALVAVGAMSVEAAVEATLLRCEAIAAADRPGAMASVFGTREQVRELLDGLPGYAAESNLNSPDQTVVSGDPAAIDALIERAQKQGITAVRLSVPRAFHSELMRPARLLLERRLHEVRLQDPALPFLSSVGAIERKSEAELRRGLIEQLTLPVDYVSQIEMAYAQGARRFLEIGPGTVLTKLTQKILSGRSAVAVSFDDRKRPGREAVEKAMTTLKSGQAPQATTAPVAPALQAQVGPSSVVTPAEVRPEPTPVAQGAPRVAAVPAVAAPAVAGHVNPVAVPRSNDGSALFSDAEWELLAADPRWLAFWRTARSSLALMARSLFASFEPRQDEDSGASHSNGSAIQLFDATELRRQRIADDVREGRFVLPSRGRTPQDSGNGSNRPAPSAPAVAVSAAPPNTALAVAPASIPAVQAPARNAASSWVKRESPEVVHAFLLEQVTTVTGYPAELIDFEQDLEADLGIDTVKQAQIFGRVRERFDLVADKDVALRDFPTLAKVQDYVLRKMAGTTVAGATTDSSPSAPPSVIDTAQMASASLVQAQTSSSAMPHSTRQIPTGGERASVGQAQGPREGSAAREAIEAKLVELVCEQSGYPAELIGLDADLEADLGIDTVKQAQVLGRVREIYDLQAEKNLSLRDFPTLRHIADYVWKSQGVVPSSVLPDAATAALAAGPSSPQTAPTATASEERQQITQRLGRSRHGQIGQLPLLRLRGSAYDMGLQHGSAQREAIVAIVERYKSFVGVEGLGRSVLQDALQRPEDYFDLAALDEIRGIADGSGLPYRHVLAYNLDSALFPEYGSGCTQIGLSQVAETSESARQVTHAVNEDSPLLLHLGDVVSRVVQVREPERAGAHVLFSLAGQVGGPNGVSASGLSVTSCVLLDRSHAGDHAKGLIHPVLIRKILEEASTTEHAAAIARDTRKTGSWSILLSHRDEPTLRVVEYDGAEHWEKSDVSEHVSTNHGLLAPATAEVPEHSQHRLDRASELVHTKNRVDETDLRTILRDRFDRGRSREVQHRTMNTVCRVDNIMGLIVDASKGQFSLTDRVARGIDEPNWLTVELADLFGARNASAAESKPGTLSGADSKEARGAAGSGSGVAISATAGGTGAPPASAGLPAPFRQVDLSELPGEARTTVAPSLAESTGTMPRYVLRARVEPLSSQHAAYQPSRLAILGAGQLATTLAARFEARGAEVHILPLDAEPAKLVSRFREWVSRGDSTDLCLLNSLDRVDAESPGILEISAEWPSLRQRWIAGPYLVAQEWIRGLPTTASPSSQRTVPTLFAVTGLGGGLGLEHVSHALPEGGATLGLLKALRREFPAIRVKALDVDPAERVDAIVGALFAELDSTDSRIEVGLLRGGRRVVKMIPLPAQIDPSRLESLNGLQSVVLTGGARGITAEIAVRLAEAGVVRLHLLGRTPLSHEVSRWRNLDDAGLQRLRQEILEDLRSHNPKVTPVEWEAALEPVLKSLEIDRTLRRIEAAGAEAVYHAVDVGDRKNLSAALDSIRATDGPIQAIVHGAGVEKSRAFTSKTPAELERTLGAKVDGALHLMALTAADPVRLFVGFSSVSGRFGGLGQADYSTASDLLAKVIAAYGAARPECHALTIDWPAWDEVGMASRAGTRALLQASGQKFLSPSEGADHFLREIACRNLESEVTITGPLAELDLDRLLPRDSALEAWQARQAAAARLPMVDAVLEHSNDRTITECRLDAGRDPFLLEHRIGPMPIMPAVVAVEVLAETATVAAGRAPAAIEGVVIETALKLAVGRRLALRCSGTSGPAGALDLALRTDFVGRGGQLIDPDRSLVHGRARFDAEPIPVPSRTSLDGQRVAFAYPQTWENDPKATRIYHGPPLRGLTEVIIGRDGWHEARITAPIAEGLRPDRVAARWWLPAAILDCCLQACGVIARAKLAAMALPGSFGRIRVGRHPGAGEACRALIHKLGHEERRIHFDITLLGENGDVLLSVEDYVAHTFAPIGAPSGLTANPSTMHRPSTEAANGLAERRHEPRRPVGTTSSRGPDRQGS